MIRILINTRHRTKQKRSGTIKIVNLQKDNSMSNLLNVITIGSVTVDEKTSDQVMMLSMQRVLVSMS